MDILSNRKHYLSRPVVSGDSVLIPGLSTIVQADMDTETNGLQTIVTRGPANTGFWIDWGDGSDPDYVAHLGTGTDVTINHTYVGAGTKQQKWIGDLSQVTYIDINNEDYVFDAGNEILKFTALTYLRCNDCTGLTGDVSSWSALTSLTYLNCHASTGLTGNVSSWSALTSLTNLICYNCTGLTGDVSSWSALTSLTDLRCYGCTGLTGDVSSWSALTSLTALYCFNCTSLTGDVSSWSALTSLTDLSCYDCSGLTGNISSWSALTSLTYLNCSDCAGLTGNVSSWSALTSLTYLSCYNCTGLIGDVSSWSALTLLATLFGYNTSVTYSSATKPAWNGTDERFQDCSWTTPMVDQYILDADTAGKTGGVINIAGSNAAHTTGGAVDTAITNLTGRGVTVTVN